MGFKIEKKYPEDGQIYHHVGEIKDGEVKTTVPVDVIYHTAMVETVIDIGESCTDQGAAWDHIAELLDANNVGQNSSDHRKL